MLNALLPDIPAPIVSSLFINTSLQKKPLKLVHTKINAENSKMLS